MGVLQNRNRRLFFLIISIALCALGFILWRVNYAGRELFLTNNNVAKSGQLTEKYDQSFETKHYQSRVQSFQKYQGERYEIAMLGNSITERCDWTRYIDSPRIVNFGIGSDITKGFLNRIDLVLSVRPKMCFIEGGVNDIDRNIPVDTTVLNIEKIIGVLKTNDITPVITSVTFLGEKYAGAEVFNHKIYCLNQKLIELSKSSDIFYLDLNSSLSIKGFLNPKYTTDEIHYNEKGNIIYARLVKQVISSLMSNNTQRVRKF